MMRGPMHPNYFSRRALAAPPITSMFARDCGRAYLRAVDTRKMLRS